MVAQQMDLSFSRHHLRAHFCRLLIGMICLLTVGLQLVGRPANSWAQSSSAASEQERLTTERFLQVLMRRPRPGTALDRVYGFHVRNDSLEEFLGSLDVPEEQEESGPKAMILGLIQQQRGKPTEAITALQKAERLMPEEAACSYYLGRAYLAVGQTENAADAIERAIERKPSRTEALPIYTELGRIYSRAGLPEKSLTVWTRLEEVFPGDTRVAARIAQTLVDEGNLQQALERYTKLAETARRDEEKIAFAVEAAEIRRKLGQTEQATAELETILARLRPGSWLYNDVRNRIEAGFLESGDSNALADYYLKQLEKQQDDLELRARLGAILVSAGRVEEAGQILTEAVKLAPENQNVRLALVDVLINKGDYQAAIMQFETLAEQDPENPDYLLRWGRLLLDDSAKPIEERRNAAAIVWQRLAKARPDDAVILSQIADRLRSINRNDDAIALYQQAIDADPDSPQYREYLGEFLHRLERKEEAIAAWEEIAAGERRNRETLVRLAEVFDTFDLSDRALETWKQAAELDLTFAQELRFADRLRNTKQYDEALQRLDLAESMAESPEERAQLLRDRIQTYAEAGTLDEQIAKLQQEQPSVEGLTKLALMHQAAGHHLAAAKSIHNARQLDLENVPVLAIAADIAERQDRFSDAIALLTELATADPRFQSSYLQRITGLHLDLGETEEALQTCDRLIDFNPASPESYQFYARTAFSIGEDEKGFDALRRAMNIARRDNGPRDMLAAAFAERYRTDEAIDLYWQSFEFERDLDGKLTLVGKLATLYERKGELDLLVDRLKELGASENERRATQLSIAEAYKTAGNFGAARESLAPLLAANPQDVDLLAKMVDYCDQVNDTIQAAEYQKQIVALADTPENRFNLLRLQVDSGVVDSTEAIAARVSLTSDPEQLGYLIRSSARRGENELAIGLCREMLSRDDSLWDVKLLLAQLLLYETGKDSQAAFEEAFALAKQVQQADVPKDAEAPTARKIGRSTPGIQTSSAQVNSFNRWSSIGYTLAQAYRLGNYANYGSSNSGFPLVEPPDFAYAQMLAGALEFVYVAKGGDQASSKSISELLEKYALPPLEEVNDPYQILTFNAYQSLAQALGTHVQIQLNRSTNLADSSPAEDRIWRLAELEPTMGADLVIQQVITRVFQGLQGTEVTKERKPLPENRLRILEKVGLAVKNGGANITYPKAYRLLFEGVVADELKRGGLVKEAKQFGYTVGKNASFDELLQMTMLRLATEDLSEQEEAELMQQLVASARKAHQKSLGANINIMPQMQSLIMACSRLGREGFLKRNRNAFLDLYLLAPVQTAGRRGSLSPGTATVHLPTPQGNFTNIAITVPLSRGLFDLQTVQMLFTFANQYESNVVERKPGEKKLPDDILAYLTEIPEEASPGEVKTRRCLAAFHDWWNEKPDLCFEKLVALCEEYPNDVDLLIEQARLASELSQPRRALEILDSFSPLDSEMLARKEMAAMNLAAELGDVKRAALAAERLYGLKMETQTQLALIDQLRRLGMQDRATAMLRRLRSNRSQQDDATQLQIARSFLNDGDQLAAAEVAYSVLKRLNRGRSSQNNVEYYRNQAYEVLRSAGRLEGLIETAEQRLESAPTSTRLKEELAQLYTAAGREEDANRLWDEVSDDDEVNPQRLVQRAQSLVQAGKREAALDAFLDAFERSPVLIGNHYYEMQQAAEDDDDLVKVYDRLCQINVSSIPSYRVSELLQLGNHRGSDSKELLASRKKFVSAILSKGYDSRVLTEVLQSLPESELKNFPAVRKAMVERFCTEEAFKPDSGLWAIYSYSDYGKANGALAPVVRMLRSSEKARSKFEETLAELQKNDKSEPIAILLDSLIAIADKQRQDEAIRSLEELVPLIQAKQKENAPAKIPGSLLWQAGLLLEESVVAEKRPGIITAFYEKATESDSMNEFQYTAKYRLMYAYKKDGQKNKARELMLLAFANIDNSQQNQWNPGYGDYQDLQEWKLLADELVKIDYPLDAIAIYEHALSDPGRFARSRQWSGGGFSEHNFVHELERARNKVTPQAAIAYLNRIELVEKPFAPWTVSPEMIRSGRFTSTFGMAVNKASENEAGQKVLQELNEKLRAYQHEDVKPWTVTAARLLISATIAEADVPELKAELLTQLPNLPEDEDEKAIREMANKYARLITLTEPAQLLLDQSQPELKQAGEELTSYLVSLAKVSQDTETQLTLSLLLGDSTKTAETILAELEARSEITGRLGISDFQSCLDIAQKAAENQELELSTRALKIALRQGPPLRQLSPREDAFAVTTTQSSSSNMQDPNEQEFQQLCRRLNNIVDLYSNAVGEQLGTVEPDPEVNSLDAAEAAAGLRLIYDALEAAVLPESRKDEVYPYAVPLFLLRSYNSSSASELHPRSLALALTRVAKLTGQSESLVERVRTRIKQNSTLFEPMAVLLPAALASGSEQIVDEAITQFEQATAELLPSPDAENKGGAGNSITNTIQQDSYRKSEVMNESLHCVLPLLDNPDGQLTQPQNDRLHDILRRVVALAESDSYTTQRHFRLISTVRNRLFDYAAETGQAKQLQTDVTRQIKSLKDYYSRFDLRSRQANINRSIETLMRDLASRGHVQFMPDLIREHLASFSGAGLDGRSITPVLLCLEMARLPLQERYDTLRKLTLGESGDGELLHWGGVVRYEKPPQLVEHKTSRLAELEALPTCVPEFPVADTILLLVEAAAELGVSEQLAAEFDARSQSPNDEPAIAAALTRLADRSSVSEPLPEPVASTVEAVRQNLKETLPKQNDKQLRVPALETYLAARLTQRPGQVTQLDKMLELCRTHAVRGIDHLFVSAINRLIGRLGLQDGQTLTADSPLKHFVAIELPPNSQTRISEMPPLYGIDENSRVIATSGSHHTLLTLKYPVVGKFELSADLKNGQFADSDLAYGGVIYHANGWGKKAQVEGINRGGTVVFPFESPAFKMQGVNRESLLVDGNHVTAQANGETYVEDETTEAYPWAAIVHQLPRRSYIENIQFTGEVTVPREVNLLSPAMRGWANTTFGRGLPDMQLPIGPEQNSAQITKQRKDAAANLENGPIQGAWSVFEGELHYRSYEDERLYDPHSHIQYLRPLLDGESLTCSFWWEWGKTELHPAIGRLRLALQRQGTNLIWIQVAGDLATVTSEVKTNEPDDKTDQFAPDNVPRNNDWNTLTMTRRGEKVIVELNDAPLLEVDIDRNARPGLIRNSQRDVKVRSLTLTGDWPETLPENLMEPAGE